MKDWNSQDISIELTAEEQKFVDSFTRKFSDLEGHHDIIIFAYLELMAKSKQGFFNKVNSAMFKGVLESHNVLAERCNTLANSTWIAVSLMDEKKAKRKIHSLRIQMISKGLNIAKRYLNINQFIDKFNVRFNIKN